MREVSTIKITAFFLFFSSLCGILLSLFAYNHLISYSGQHLFPDAKRGTYSFECNIDNDFCTTNLHSKVKIAKLTNCDEKVYSLKVYKDKSLKQEITWNEARKKELEAKKLNALMNLKSDFKYYIEIIPTGEINKDQCIKYSNIYFIYKLFPNLLDLYTKIKSSTTFGTSIIVNPFIDGETSISNIAKRYPFNYIFKPFLFLSSLLMMVYWLGYFAFFKKNGLNKNNSFVYFGCLSAFFLFLHVLFLGSNPDIPNFNELRRLVIVLFIFFELISEFLLARKIYLNKEFLYSMMKKSIILSKIIFVYVAVLITIISLTYMALFDQTQKFNNVLEWNYFIFLIFFYALSVVIWKKI